MAIEKRQRRRGIAVVVILVVLGLVAFVILKVFTPKHVPIDEAPDRNNSPI
jgi:type II secretory pathway component PulK